MIRKIYTITGMVCAEDVEAPKNAVGVLLGVSLKEFNILGLPYPLSGSCVTVPCEIRLLYRGVNWK